MPPAVFLALAGCLLLLPAPPAVQCEEDGGASCPGNFVCSLDGLGCASFCWDDLECKGGYTCVFGDCEPTCQDASCPGHYSCEDDLNACNTYCGVDADCRSGYHCCHDYPSCDFGDCVR